MKQLAIAFLLLFAAGCVSDRGADTQAIEARGRALAEANCATCHATGASGESPAPEAPPFRTLSRNYRVASLEEALAEGISVGHPAMPEFTFSPPDVTALVTYLQSIQEDR